MSAGHLFDQRDDAKDAALDLGALVPALWRPYVDGCDALERVAAFLQTEFESGRGYQPCRERIFRALELTEPERVRVVLLAQDPYPTPGVPTGLAFSVDDETSVPDSLHNILCEYKADLEYATPTSGDLSAWARAGVLLLNTVLTCQPGVAASHAKCGWTEVTRHLLCRLAENRDGLVFLCWGKLALRLVNSLPLHGHDVVESPHPSPRSAWRGWFGSRPFTRCNHALVEMGQKPIGWCL